MRTCILAVMACVFGVYPAWGAHPDDGLFNEIRVGGYQHDTGIIGTHKEAGLDFSLEAWTAGIKLLDVIGDPRFMVGFAVNSAGRTDQVYTGLIKTWDISEDVFSFGDAVFLDGILGGSWNDGKIDVVGTPSEKSWKSHGSHLLFREGLNLGYRWPQGWSISVGFDHISNAGLAKRNEGMNDIGLIVGIPL